MSIYSALEKLSESLFLETNDLSENYISCWNNSTIIVDNICNYFHTNFQHKILITSVSFILNNENYRQGASVCKIEIKFEKDQNFIILLECLIDFGKVWLKIKNRPSNPSLKSMANKIESNYNTEWLCDLNDI